MNVSVNHLSFSYPDGTRALHKLTCQLTKNKVAILGSNGSGKSTLLQHLNGLYIPQSGTVEINGTRITKKNCMDIRKKVGLVFDHPDHQIFAPTVFDDIAFGPRNKGESEKDVARLVYEMMDWLNISHLQNKPPYHLSLGQKKKVAIAGVLAMEPEIILCDEPFSGLDPYSLDDFIEILNRLANLGQMVIITTHDVDLAYSWAEECLILQRGKALLQGDVHILENEKVMAEAKLRLPSLFSLFKETKYRPTNIQQAKTLLEQIVRKEPLMK